MAEPFELSAADAAAAIAAGELSPVELAASTIERIEALNGGLTAYVEPTFDLALDQAATLADEAARGELRGPLHGVTLGLKDLIDTAGIPTRAGSAAYGDRVPEIDATVTRRLRDAGSVLLGKTATHELAYGVTTDNPRAFGTTRNPWSTAHSPGGSSGGSGAATVARLAAVTIGTDTGGSIRIPAAFCGCVGFKPTFGVVSRAGISPLSWQLDHAGPLTRTVADAALVLDAVSGYDPADEATFPGVGGVTGVAASLAAARTGGGDLSGVRVGLPRSTAWASLQPGVRDAAEVALGELTALGAELVEVNLPDHTDLAGPTFLLVSAECRVAHRAIWPDQRQELGPDVEALLSIPELGGDQTIEVLRAIAAYRQAVRAVFDQVDLLASPTIPIVAPMVGSDTVDVDGESIPTINAVIANTMPYNLAHLPAVSVPCGFSDGLPVGLQLAGPPFADARVLQAAAAFEQATTWHTLRPADPT